MTAESVLRCGLLKQCRQLTYEELAFHVLDSASFQAFARLPMGRAPSRATLQANISAITADTWEAINQQLMAADYTAGVERGTMWRVDTQPLKPRFTSPETARYRWMAYGSWCACSPKPSNGLERRLWIGTITCAAPKGERRRSVTAEARREGKACAGT